VHIPHRHLLTASEVVAILSLCLGPLLGLATRPSSEQLVLAARTALAFVSLLVVVVVAMAAEPAAD